MFVEACASCVFLYLLADFVRLCLAERKSLPASVAFGAGFRAAFLI